MMPEASSKMFQIYDYDLDSVEESLKIVGSNQFLTPLQNECVLEAQQVMKHVRENYGPHKNVTIIPCDE